jgi:hypothetical protein
MKRKLFIGSSTKGLPIAKKVKAKIDSECGDWIHTDIWDEGSVFTLNKDALDSLIKASRKFDYGILVATKDDKLETKKIIKAIPRDNVMFEMGMFLGSLGLSRAFLLVEKANKLPTDYNGVTVPYFQRKKKGSLEEAIDKIILAVRETKNSYNLKPVPSAALALGYFNNFIQPLAKKKHEENEPFKVEIFLPKNLKDIHAEVTAYKNSNPSNEESIYGDGKRPIAFELKRQKNNYWDFPTTLLTLDQLMDLFIPSSEVGGISKEKQDWIEHELRNFKGTIEALVQASAACRDKVVVSRLT